MHYCLAKRISNGDCQSLLPGVNRLLNSLPRTFTRERKVSEVEQAFLPVTRFKEEDRQECLSYFMKALRVEKKKLAVREIEKPVRGDEALVRVLLSGICNTDLEIARGYAGFKGTIGHEFVGVVEETSNPTLAGKRVVGEINAGCGQCELWRGCAPRHCSSRTVLGIVGRDGAHAEFLRLPAENLVPVPQRIPDEHAVF